MPRFEKGKVIDALVIRLDILEQIAHMKNSTIESRLIIDSIPGLVAVLTATGVVELVSRQVLEYFGRTLQELRQWKTSDVVHPEDLPRVIEVFTRSIASGSPYEIVQRFRSSDGVYRWFQNRGYPVHDSDRQIVRWCVLFADVDDQKRAEDAVRASERNLKLIIDTIPAGAWSACPDGSSCAAAPPGSSRASTSTI